jgi:nucleoside-diphosphate-sugar epimerase
MGSIQPVQQRILVTGANGFIGAHCVADLLAKGFEVVGTVRTTVKAEQVLSQHLSNPALSVQVVPDITDLHAFDSAINGCTGVLHLAAPFGYAYTNFETELLIPSINGTRSICLAASKTASVKRVVITSSFASVFDASAGPSPGRIYTEKDWSPLTYEDGKNAPATPIAYRASKVLAEKTAWEFVEREKPHWDLVTLCPGMVFGPLFPGTINSLKELNTSNGIIWGLFDAEKVPETKAPCMFAPRACKM